MMRIQDKTWIAALLAGLAFVWLRDTRWISSASDTLPILLAIPVFLWLGAPWKLTEHRDVSSGLLLVGAVLTSAGVVGNLTSLLALAWTCFAWAWLSSRMDNEQRARVRPLLVLPILAFPWITLDLQAVGWWFRLSGAWFAENVFSALEFTVVRHGTSLEINDLPVAVSAPCAGLNTLQSLLVIGSVVVYSTLGHDRCRLWVNLPLLFVAAWLANTLRIVTICAAGVLGGPEFADGAFHTLGGLLVVGLMFAVTAFVIRLQKPEPWNAATPT